MNPPTWDITHQTLHASGLLPAVEKVGAKPGPSCGQARAKLVWDNDDLSLLDHPRPIGSHLLLLFPKYAASI